VAAKLRPWEIRQLKSVGATNAQIKKASEKPHIHALMIKQRERLAGMIEGMPSEEWEEDMPDVVYYYHPIS
jgi:hypothetical protein